MINSIPGGITAAKGFRAASCAAGIKYRDRTDMAMILSSMPCTAAGVFTTNRVKAAPVLWDREIIRSGSPVQAVVVNAGWAVAYTNTTDIYLPYERQAEAARRGLWCGTFYRPWDWRTLRNRRFKVKINHPKPTITDSDSGGGFNFWGLF